MAFARAFSGAEWEQRYGYCRAVRAGSHVFVSGTAPVGALEADASGQARRCFEILFAALKELGAEPHHVVRTRMFVTDISQADAFGQGHRAAFSAHPPATSMVEVKALIDPRMLIEIEADAVIE